jgi:hypothetical protein
VLKGKVLDFGYFGKDSLFRIRLATGHVLSVNAVNTARMSAEQAVATWEEDVYLSIAPEAAMLFGLNHERRGGPMVQPARLARCDHRLALSLACRLLPRALHHRHCDELCQDGDAVTALRLPAGLALHPFRNLPAPFHQQPLHPRRRHLGLQRCRRDGAVPADRLSHGAGHHARRKALCSASC